jgi:hypothetical protein
VNDKDLGEENVYIVASREPIQSLDNALQKVKDGKVTAISQDSLLKSFTSVAPGTAPAGCKTRALELDTGSGAAAEGPACTRSRGLVLDAPEEEGVIEQRPGNKGRVAMGEEPAAGSKVAFTGRTVMEVRTDPGDSTIVKVFPFKHVSEQAYPQEVKSRGLVIEF